MTQFVHLNKAKTNQTPVTGTFTLTVDSESYVKATTGIYFPGNASEAGYLEAMDNDRTVTTTIPHNLQSAAPTTVKYEADFLKYMSYAVQGLRNEAYEFEAHPKDGKAILNITLDNTNKTIEGKGEYQTWELTPRKVEYAFKFKWV